MKLSFTPIYQGVEADNWSVGLWWNEEWWKIYFNRIFYDCWHHVIRVGPFCIYWGSY